MKVAILYLWPQDNAAEFEPYANQWAQSFKANDSGFAYDLHVCACGPRANYSRPHWLPYRTSVHHYEGGGYDIGAQQFSAKKIDADLLVTGTARHYYWKPGWLARIVEAFQQYGDGLYAAGTSLEKCPLGCKDFPNPHIRTANYAMTPERFRRYPFLIDNREKGYLFESGEWNIARWFWDSGLPVVQVCWDGFYPNRDSWRNVRNSFRKGDQSNLLVRDKHTDNFDAQDPRTKLEWRKRAWGE